MSSAIATSSYRAPEVIRSNSMRIADTTRVGRMSAKGVADDLSSAKGIRIISLKEEGGDLPDGIDCIAADFAKVQRGVIHSLMSPMTMTLKKEDQQKRLNLTNLHKLKGIIKKLAPGSEEKPFARFEKVQVMYVPLFNKEESDHGSLTISITDEGKEAAGKDPIIQSVTCQSDEMALIELSMNYFVAKKDISKIKLEMSVDRLPIEGRAYGAMFIAFFVHEDHSPFRMTPKQSTLIYVDSLDAPTDINTSSVFKGLGDKISNDVKTKREAMKTKKRFNDLSLRKDLRNVEIQKTDSNSDETEEDIEMPRRKGVIKSEALNLQFPTPAVQTTKRHVKIDTMGVKTMLDTGSADHYLKYSSINPSRTIKNFAGIDEMEIEAAEVTFIANGKEMKMSHAWIHSDLRFHHHLLSLTKLKSDGIIDSMSMENDEVFLMRDSEVVMQFDSTTPGRMWLKNDAWKLEKEYEEPRGLGIKYVM